MDVLGLTTSTPPESGLDPRPPLSHPYSYPVSVPTSEVTGILFDGPGRLSTHLHRPTELFDSTRTSEEDPGVDRRIQTEK